MVAIVNSLIGPHIKQAYKQMRKEACLTCRRMPILIVATQYAILYLLLYAELTARLMNLNGVTQIQNDLKNGGYYSALKFHDITLGNNGGYTAASGWDPVTGMASFKPIYSSTTKVTTTDTLATTDTTFACLLKEPSWVNNESSNVNNFYLHYLFLAFLQFFL